MKSIHSVALAVGAAVASLIGIGPAVAHHSTAAFDTTRVVKIEGTVTQFRWINPHASFKVDGKSEGDDPDGVWTVEMTAPNMLINQGWTRTALASRRPRHDLRQSAAQRGRAERRQHRRAVRRRGAQGRQGARPNRRQGRGLEQLARLIGARVERTGRCSTGARRAKTRRISFTFAR